MISSCSSCWNFNPRSLAGATAYGPACAASLHISIHAPLRERPVAHHRRQQKHNFNPRSLTGATPLPISLFVILAFQSTLPHGSDQLHTIDGSRSIISIHAPSRERHWRRRSYCSNRHFNPRSLAGATKQLPAHYPSLDISIHAPLRERHQYARASRQHQDFNPRSLTGATSQQISALGTLWISIHAPSRERPWRL